MILEACFLANAVPNILIYTDAIEQIFVKEFAIYSKFLWSDMIINTKDLMLINLVKLYQILDSSSYKQLTQKRKVVDKEMCRYFCLYIFSSLACYASKAMYEGLYALKKDNWKAVFYVWVGLCQVRLILDIYCYKFYFQFKNLLNLQYISSVHHYVTFNVAFYFYVCIVYPAQFVTIDITFPIMNFLVFFRPNQDNQFNLTLSTVGETFVFMSLIADGLLILYIIWYFGPR